MRQEITVPHDETPKTVENFLKKHFPIGYVRKLLRKNGVRRNGRKIKAGDFLSPSDQLQLFIPFETSPHRPVAAPQSRPSWDVLFEDANLVVIDKPAGVAVHEGRNILKRETVIGILQARYRSQGITPRLVHRLDKETSGVLVIAKNEAVAATVQACFEAEQTEKEYLCLIAGRIREREGKIDLPLPGRDGKPVRALTRFKIEKRFSQTMFVRARIATGRMHQIRLHFAKLGHPIVMDEQHGDFAFNRQFRRRYGLKRQFLHAARLSLQYEGKTRVWSAPLPADLKQTLDALEIDYRNEQTA